VQRTLPDYDWGLIIGLLAASREGPVHGIEKGWGRMGGNVNPTQRLDDVQLGRDVVIRDFVNLYGCTIGDETRVGTFIEIQRGVTIGARCKISSHTFICEGVTIEDEVFVGHNVSFINDLFPRSTNVTGSIKNSSDWQLMPTIVRFRASIGTGATILAGVEIGEGALVGAGSVVTRSVPPFAVVAGNPARILRYLPKEA
jgi:acetyltransferase-like isoleucine patch superfamily enzyme